ncbi:MAG: O-antigen ligase protein, partial [Burkholderia sp.]|nr:O-antigen ligase protein [Burkholderia sp.]
QDYGGMLRDAIAYTFVFTFSVMMAATFSDAADRRLIIWRIVVIGSISLVLQIGTGLGKVPMPGVDPWYWDRFRGWAENPNQMGFFALFIALLGLHLADQAATKVESFKALAAIVPAFVAGMMSRSDSFVIGLVASGGLFITLKSMEWLQDREMAPSLRGAAVALALLAMPLAIIISVPYAAASLSRIESVSNQVYDDNDQGDTRLHLWAEAIDKGIQSGLVGFGPGPHLTSKSFKRPPPDKFEVHNTLLDLLTQGGVVAMAAFVWISVTALLAASRAGHPALAGLVVGLLVFSMFHYVLRQPIFWFGIVLCLLGMTRSVEILSSGSSVRRSA